MNKISKAVSATLLAGGLIFSATACVGPGEYEKRKEAQGTSQITNSLEKQNAQKKRDKEEDPNAIRYVYLLNYGEYIGYYVIQGKVSSSSSQVGPESEVIRYYGEGYALDSAKDDGTYGPGDPGIFFFLTDGTMVETSVDFVVSDRPIPVNAPKLGGEEKK